MSFKISDAVPAQVEIESSRFEDRTEATRLANAAVAAAALWPASDTEAVEKFHASVMERTENLTNLDESAYEYVRALYEGMPPAARGQVLAEATGQLGSLLRSHNFGEFDAARSA